MVRLRPGMFHPSRDKTMQWLLPSFRKATPHSTSPSISKVDLRTVLFAVLIKTYSQTHDLLAGKTLFDTMIFHWTLSIIDRPTRKPFALSSRKCGQRENQK
jgi:hypothetical protein